MRTAAKRMFRTALIATTVVATTAIGLSGCSGTSQSNDKTTLKWWSWDIGPTEKQLVSGFEKENPDIKVLHKTYSNADYLNVIRSGLTSNSGPDVFQVAPGSMLANYGSLAVDLAPYAKKAWGSKWKSKFYDSATKQLEFDGKQAALPNYMSAAGLIFYNQTLVKKLGISVPKTVPEWAKTCKTVTAAGYTCLAQGAKDAWANTDIFLALANSAAPKEIYSAIDGKKSWTSPGLVEAMKAWRSLFTDGIVGSGATAMAEYPDAFNAFLSNKAVFLSMGTWNTPGTMTKAGVKQSQKGLSAKIDGIFLSAPWPAATADSEPTKLFGGVANGWSISAKSKHPDAAAKLVEFLSGGAAQTMIGDVASFPALLSAKVSTADLIAPDVQAPDVQRQQKQLIDLVGYREIPYPDLATAIGQALSSVAAGTKKPEEALKSIQAASDKIDRS